MLCNEVVKIFDDIYFRDKIIYIRYDIKLYFWEEKASGINNNACTQSTKPELGQKFNDRGNETVKVKEMNFFSTLHIFCVRCCLGEERKLG
jgi:tRNA U34 5-methylaminomethyl-2-thiouridine-forming methyltransferase MnmC